jgi:hypothetical protein
MRLALELPAPWLVREAPDGELVASRSGAVLRFGPLILVPDEPHAFLLERARADAPPGARLDVGPVQALETRDGWPLSLVEISVTDRDGAREERVAALYVFLEHAALALLRAPGRAPEGLLAVLESGRPDWRGNPVALVDLWDLGDPPSAGAVLDPVLAAWRARDRADGASGPDAARLLDEVVFDRFAADGLRMQVIAPLGRRGPVQHVIVFRAVDAEDNPLPATVLVETSEVARAAGTPYVLAVIGPAGYHVVGAASELPSYGALRREACRLSKELLGTGRLS